MCVFFLGAQEKKLELNLNRRRSAGGTLYILP